MKWYPGQRHPATKTEIEEMRSDIDDLKERTAKHGHHLQPVECETCGCLLQKKTAHEVAELGWEHHRTHGAVPKDAIKVTEGDWDLYLGSIHEYDAPLVTRKYYCKIHKPKEKKPAKRKK